MSKYAGGIRGFDADTLDGYHATDFQLASDADAHTNDLLMETGDSLLTEANYFITI